MHRFEFRETDGFPCQSVNPRSEIQVFAYNLLHIALNHFMLVICQDDAEKLSIIDVIMTNTQRFQQGLQRFEHLILALAKDISQYVIGHMIHGILQPTWIELVADIGPLLIHFSLETDPFDTRRPTTIRI